MQSKKLVWFGFATALAMIVLFYLWGKYNDKSRFDWNESAWDKKAYNETVDQPYGTLVFRRLLDQYFEANKVFELKKDLKNELKIDSAGRSAYVFIGEGMFLDSLDTQRLLDFVAAGNTALISSKSIPFDLMFHLYMEECDYDSGWDDYSVMSDTLRRCRLFTPDIPETTLFLADQNRPVEYRWNYIPDHIFCDELPQEPLGMLNDSMINFAQFPFGEGRFLLHTTPIAFTNFHLQRPEVRQYVAGILSHLPQSVAYWDAYSRVPESVSRQRNQNMGGGDNLPEEHLLSFLIEREPLAWAWYLLVAGALIWVIFKARRRQRAIPILPRNENLSAEFIQTIAHLHFRESNFQNISIQAMRLFMSQVRERYGLHVTIDPETMLIKIDAEFVPKLARMSQTTELEIEEIIRQYEAIVRFWPTERQMTDFHQVLEHFWKKAR